MPELFVPLDTNWADNPKVIEVGLDGAALLFGKAMERASELRKEDVAKLDYDVFAFDQAWDRWKIDGTPVDRDERWQASIERFIAAGLDLNDLEHFIHIAMRSKVPNDRVWRYFCKCCWNEVTERQELARRLIEDQEV